MSALIDDELVEKVARALCKSAGGAPDAPLCAGGNPLWMRYRPDARAALAVAVPIVADKCHAVAMGYSRERRATAEEVTDSRVLRCDLKRDAAVAAVVAMRIRSLSTETKA